jgi:hypothetical protein
MIEKKEIVKSNEQLLQAREEGLKQAQQVNTMQAHGKILGMDTFSWMNPQVDMLATLLSSFPFSILWIGTQQQIEQCLKLYPELSKNIESILIHDTSSLGLNHAALQKINTIACVDGVEYAFEFVKSMKLKKGVLMYTNENETAITDRKAFEEFVQIYR